MRFRLETKQKDKLYAEAERRAMSAPDLLRELIDALPEPRKTKAARKAKAPLAAGAASG